MEDREKEKKEKMMEDYKKSVRKPRPRDYIDYDKIELNNKKHRNELNLNLKDKKHNNDHDENKTVVD